jgi:hypothetical protein
LVNTTATGVRRATDAAGGALDRARQHFRRLLAGATPGVARYAEALAEHTARKARLKEESEDKEFDERLGRHETTVSRETVRDEPVRRLTH